MRKTQRPDFTRAVQWLSKHMTTLTQACLVLCLALISVAYIRIFNPTASESAFSPASRPLPIYNVDTQEKIAISFDAAWGEEKTDEILQILKDRDIETTFFLVGYWVDKYPDRVRQIAEAGHEIGNHSYDHRRLTKLNEAGVRSQVSRCEEALASLGEYRPHLLRPPEGAMNATVRRVARAEGYRLILWDIDTRDWAHTPPDTITRNVLESVQAGDIILMHDYIGHDSPTPAALRRLIPALLERGYRFVTVSRLIDG